MRRLELQAIDDVEERKTVKVGNASADLPDSVLAHENGCMGVVHQIAREVRNFVNQPVPQSQDVAPSVPECRELVRRAAPV